MAQIEKRGKSYRIRASSGYTVSGKQVRPSVTWTPDPKMTPRQVEKELQRQVVLFDDRCKSMLGNGHIKLEIFIDRYLMNTHARIFGSGHAPAMRPTSRESSQVSAICIWTKYHPATSSRLY